MNSNFLSYASTPRVFHPPSFRFPKLQLRLGCWILIFHFHSQQNTQNTNTFLWLIHDPGWQMENCWKTFDNRLSGSDESSSWFIYFFFQPWGERSRLFAPFLSISNDSIWLLTSSTDYEFAMEKHDESFFNKRENELKRRLSLSSFLIAFQCCLHDNFPLISFSNLLSILYCSFSTFCGIKILCWWRRIAKHWSSRERSVKTKYRGNWKLKTQWEPHQNVQRSEGSECFSLFDFLELFFVFYLSVRQFSVWGTTAQRRNSSMNTKTAWISTLKRKRVGKLKKGKKSSLSALDVVWSSVSSAIFVEAECFRRNSLQIFSSSV